MLSSKLKSFCVNSSAWIPWIISLLSDEFWLDFQLVIILFFDSPWNSIIFSSFSRAPSGQNDDPWHGVHVWRLVVSIGRILKHLLRNLHTGNGPATFEQSPKSPGRQTLLRSRRSYGRIRYVAECSLQRRRGRSSFLRMERAAIANDACFVRSKASTSRFAATSRFPRRLHHSVARRSESTGSEIGHDAGSSMHRIVSKCVLSQREAQSVDHRVESGIDRQDIGQLFEFASHVPVSLLHFWRENSHASHFV